MLHSYQLYATKLYQGTTSTNGRDGGRDIRSLLAWLLFDRATGADLYYWWHSQLSKQQSLLSILARLRFLVQSTSSRNSQHFNIGMICNRTPRLAMARVECSAFVHHPFSLQRNYWSGVRGRYNKDSFVAISFVTHNTFSGQR